MGAIENLFKVEFIEIPVSKGLFDFIGILFCFINKLRYSLNASKKL
jgi:hypothetical protein